MALGKLGAAAAFVLVCLIAAVPASAQPAIHLGVASCAGSNCHGATHPSKGSYVEQNEYLIWSKSDKHHKAYSVLLDARSKRIARNLGIANAATSPLCLNCHADNVPPDQRGPQFQISDGVGCEACHGGASTWLGLHISGATHKQNLAAGLYPLGNPVKRAAKCLTCHFGDPSQSQHFVTHRIMGAGHPRMGFELDTYTMAQPAHFVVDKDYVQRIGPVDDAQMWAVGQAASLVKRMDALLAPRLKPKGVFPELVLFDCQACHHVYDWRQAQPESVTGVPPGSPKLYDAYAVMLEVIAKRLAPADAKALHDQILTMRHASIQNWSAIGRQASAMRLIAEKLTLALSRHDFTAADRAALAKAIVQLSLSPEGASYANAEQETMALASIGSAMKRAGQLNPSQAKTMTTALNELYSSFAGESAYRYEAFVEALKKFRIAVPR